MQNLPDLFELFLNEMRVPVTKISLPINSAADFPDMGVRARFYGEGASFVDKLPEMDWTDDGPARIYVMRDRFHCRYILSPDRSAPGQCWLVGPYLTSEPTRQEIKTLCKKLGGSEEAVGFIHIYYKMVPKLLDKSMTEALFRSQAALRYPVSGFEMISWDMGDSVLVTDAPVSTADVLPQRRHVAQTYATESLLMDCISQGNYQGAITQLSRLQRNGLVAKADSILRDGKNSLLVINVLCRVAGYKGGVRPDQLDKMARYFILKIESSTRMAELPALRDNMIRKYCEASREKNAPRYSPVVQKAVDSAAGSFHTKLTLNSLAEQFHVNPSYLSTLFKKETGLSFTDFLARQRLSYAKKLLRETELPINVIATECGIVDNNYFARFFKAREGMTPAQYRQKNQ